MGTGYHGGFGATKGSAYKKSSSNASAPVINRVIRKQDIIDALMGVTEMSTTIAKSIAAKHIGVNILGDELFESTLDLNKIKNPKEVKAYQDGNHMYIRRSAISGFSVFVHEGTHAYEHYHDIPQFKISSHKGEYRAYVNEHDYQVKSGEHVDYKDYDDIWVHIKLNYKY